MNLRTPDNKKAILEFISEGVSCTVTSPKGIDFNRMRLTDGFLFEVSDSAIEKQQSAINRIVKALGSVKGHASDVEPLLWQSVVKVLQKGQVTPTQQDVDALLNTLEANASKEVQIIKPCHCAVLMEKTNNVIIGPVTIRRSKAALPDLQRAFPKAKIGTGDVPEITVDVFDVNLPVFIWQVKLVAASQVREEQAAWLVDIALSLLRLGVKWKDLGINPPTLGKLEAPPFIQKSADHSRLTIGPGQKSSFGGWTMPSFYQLGIPAQRALLKKDFVQKADLVFSAKSKSLAERFAQGLGWMARGRQSTDRPTRLLYFFTAIESLLSDSDKTAPVVQTVARHAAVLLNDKNKSRASISRTIRQLYGLRSSLVHTGKRGVADKDSNTIQYITELLFHRVWSDIDLSMKHARFVEVLRVASYGMPPEF